METITPGLQPDMTNDAYRAAPGINKGKLDDFDEGAPVHYWDKHINPDRPIEERSEALMLGDAIHTAIGEPDLMSRFVTVPEDAPKRPTKSQINAKKPSLESQGSISYWAAFLDEHKDKVILTPAQMQTVMACRDSAWSNPLVKGLLTGGKAEQTYYAIDRETGALIKCRLDYDRLEDGLIVDIKSTEDAGGDGFYKSGEKYRYHVQDGHYTDVVEQAHGLVDVVQDFAFIAIEKKRPHACGVYYYSDEERREGRDIALATRRKIRDYTERFGETRWPDYTEAGAQVMMSRWNRQRAARG